MKPVEKYIAALDVGTTIIRCFIYDSNFKICGSAYENVHLKQVICEKLLHILNIAQCSRLI